MGCGDGDGDGDGDDDGDDDDDDDDDGDGYGSCMPSHTIAALKFRGPRTHRMINGV